MQLRANVQKSDTLITILQAITIQKRTIESDY